MNETKPQADSENAAAASEYPFAQTFLAFGWMCSNKDCLRFNYTSWSDYVVYGRIQECVKCEQAHKIKEPFK